MALRTVCSIGSTDPWNAAGVGLDVSALAECGVRAVTVVAGITAQDRDGVRARQAVAPALVVAQLRCLRASDIAAYRIGALLDVASLEAVADVLDDATAPVVHDPVLSASGGGEFATVDVERALVARLLPKVRLFTPNLAEAARLTGGEAIVDVDGMEAAARALCELGADAVLVKGGHLVGAAVDVLVRGGATTVFEAPRLAGTLRGTGCLLACAAAAALARGESVEDAVAFARAFVRSKFATARTTGGMHVAY